jgi:hypothetical protein
MFPRWTTVPSMTPSFETPAFGGLLRMRSTVVIPHGEEPPKGGVSNHAGPPDASGPKRLDCISHSSLMATSATAA